MEEDMKLPQTFLSEQHRFGFECVPIMVIADTIMRNAYRMLRIAATRI